VINISSEGGVGVGVQEQGLAGIGWAWGVHAGGGMRGQGGGVGGCGVVVQLVFCALDVYCGKRCVLSADLNVYVSCLNEGSQTHG
jgi:hypothetical protein